MNARPPPVPHIRGTQAATRGGNAPEEYPIAARRFADTLREQRDMKLSGGLYYLNQVDLAYNSNRIEGSRLSADHEGVALPQARALPLPQRPVSTHAAALSGVGVPTAAAAMELSAPTCSSSSRRLRATGW